MKNRIHQLIIGGVLLILCLVGWDTARAATNALVGWNDLGMHCMDSDYRVFSILPPYNVIHAEIIYQGNRLTSSNGFTVTYQAVADPDGSINKSSQGKTTFWDYDVDFFGVNLAPDMGLAGFPMPGAANTPQLMAFDAARGWFTAEGIPITPVDDAGKKNFYPLMRLIARTNGVAFSTNDVVLPVSDEMDCRACHASGTQAAAQPANGWVWNTDPEMDYRLNILRAHDEARNPATYPAVLAANGYNPAGLYRSVVADGKPVLCARCHASNALPGTGYGNIRPLTQAIHGHHATVADPDTGLALDNTLNRNSCYRCHPGSTTRCLRGVMGDAVAADGSRAIQCQSCHGPMSVVGATNRVGWLDEPDCQSCHTGTATSNNGQIRYTTVFSNTNNWTVRVPVNQTFATTPNVPSAPYSLYRFSTGHGNLHCEACHGSPHAEFPADRNDNIRVIQRQGHGGMILECRVCHDPNPPSADDDGGPHGMHATTSAWVTGGHKDSAADCAACHGSNLRGTELSDTKAERTYSVFGTKTFWAGQRIGCFTCHNGSGSGSSTPWRPAVISNVASNTTSGAKVFVPLSVRDTNTTVQSVTVRVISQPANGTVGLTNWNTTNWAAIYYPDPGFVGTDTFNFAAWNTRVDSLLRTGTVSVTQGPFSLSAKALVPPSFAATWAAPFGVMATPSNVVGVLTYDWDFGDGAAHSTNQFASHAYVAAGVYNWKVISRVTAPGGTASATNSGSIAISAPLSLRAIASGPALILSWPQPTGDALLEQTVSLSPTSWTTVTNVPVLSGGQLDVTVPRTGAAMFYRLRKL